MSKKLKIDFDILIDDAMRKWPKTLPVLIRHNMHCIGCPLATFHTIADAAEEHDIDEVSFFADMAECMS
ncbi:MAG: DUF1858 domain-containing protein [Rhizobiales bacterium]|nr:DUF1858 domain-containing protein [Hyphomicrobiales bacterium]